MRLCLAAILALLLVGGAINKSVADQKSGITLRVRTIKAVSGGNESPALVSKELSDISRQLAALPYTKFSLLSSNEVDVPVKKRGWLKLKNGDGLVFRMLYRENGKAGISLAWHDSNGSEILNTKLHFECHNPIVTGTNSGERDGVVLAINVVE
jgi:hypothetical protein